MTQKRGLEKAVEGPMEIIGENYMSIAKVLNAGIEYGILKPLCFVGRKTLDMAKNYWETVWTNVY